MCALLYNLCNFTLQLACVCRSCEMYEVNYPPLTGATTVFVLSFASAISHCCCTLSVTDLYTFSIRQTGGWSFCEIL